MENEKRREIEVACLRLANDLCYYRDRLDLEAYARLYAPDGTFIRPGLTVKGREAIVQLQRERPPHIVTRHLGVNAVVDVISEDEAHGRGNLLVYFHDTANSQTQPVSIADYIDTYALTDEGWKIAVREVARAF